MSNSRQFKIYDDFGNECFDGKAFKSLETAFDFLLQTYPVTYNQDGTQNDREEELDQYWINQT